MDRRNDDEKMTKSSGNILKIKAFRFPIVGIFRYTKKSFYREKLYILWDGENFYHGNCEARYYFNNNGHFIAI